MKTLSFTHAAIVALACAGAPAPAAEHTKISSETIRKEIADSKATLVDVREKSEWDDGHLKDAVLFPLSQLKGGNSDAIAKVLPKNKIIYVHCASGSRSLQAADALQKLGYDVRPLKLGYAELLQDGFAPAAK